MKNIFKTLAIVALGFFATSCVSADVEDVQVASGEGVVNFTVSTPGATSRAIADGKSATQLTCGVYDAQWNYLTKVDGQFDGSSLTTTVSIRLVNKKVYNFVFWAQDPNAGCYTLTLEGEPNVAVTYNGDANDESRDAFFGQLTDLEVNGTMNEKVELTRPFAQVNFGTLDTELAKVAGFDITVPEAKTTFTTRAYNTLYLGKNQHGTVGGAQDVQVTFSDAALPNEDLYLLNDTAHTTPYDWLAMNYILVPESEGTLSECTLVVKDNKGQSVEVKYPNAPVKRNWRTNLVGNLLTDQVVIEVEILPIPEGEYTEIVPDKPYEENGVYSVASADEMLWIAQQAGLDNGFFGNKTITLGGNIDMTGYEWTTPRVWSNLEYLTTFDGKGHTISGLTAPLFKEFRGTIKNLVIDGANIESEAGPLGAVVCNLAGNIENVTVKNSTLSGVISSRATADTKRWGAIVGLHSVGDAKNLLAENVTISGVTKVAGGLIGTINETNNRLYTNCKAANCQVEAGDNVVGAIVGQIYVSGVKFENCSQESTVPTALVGSGDYIELVPVESLDEAVAVPNATVNLCSAEYTIPTTIADGVTIIGEEGSVLNCSNNIAAKNITIKNTHLKGNVTFDNASGTFEDCKIDGIFGNTDQHLSFKNCQLGGYIASQANFTGSASFEGCEISGWCAIGGTGEATFKDCKFPYSSNFNFLRIYNLDKAEFENCEFDPNYTIDVKGINGTKNVDVVFNNCKVANTVATLSTRAASTKKFIELFDLACLKKYTAATYVIDGTRVNSKTTIITNAEELIAKAAVNAAADEVVILTADIDLAGKTFGGLYGFNPENNNTFDGMGFTVSNWTNEEGKSDFGFIRGWVGPIKNVTIANAKLKTSGRSAIVAGKVYGDIKNCHVVNSTIEDSYWACGLIAGHYNSGSVYNCTVTGSSVKSNGGTGGIVGLLNESAGTRGFYNCSITNSTVNNTGVYGESYCGALVCGLINISNSTVEFEGCTFDGNTKEGKYVGDLYYAAGSDITIVVK